MIDKRLLLIPNNFIMVLLCLLFSDVLCLLVLLPAVCHLGTGEHASQHGMNIGGIRHASDIKADDMTPQSQGMLHPQTGSCLLFVEFLRYMLGFLNITYWEYLNLSRFLVASISTVCRIESG